MPEKIFVLGNLISFIPKTLYILVTLIGLATLQTQTNIGIAETMLIYFSFKAHFSFIYVESVYKVKVELTYMHQKVNNVFNVTIEDEKLF